jgi:hypothetical protein
MPIDEHYFIEQTDDGRFAVRTKHSDLLTLCSIEEEAIAAARILTNDHPNVRVRNVESGGRNKWRSRK